MKRRTGTAMAILAIMSSAIGSHGQAQEQAGSAALSAEKPAMWEGVWVAERNFGPRLHGPVSVYRSGENWVAKMQGETVPAERIESQDGSVSWSFSFFDQGRFVGRQVSKTTGIEGHWLQPAGTVQYYPLAIPVRLKPTESETYDGVITPLPQDVSLNIPLFAEAGGNVGEETKYRTFLRNPQANYGIRFRIDSAKQVGDEIEFSNADGEVLAVGQIIEPGERFTLLFPRFGETFDFTKRDRSDAPGFYPRRSPDNSTTLQQPTDIGDGWKTAALQESGINEQPLASLIRSIAAFEPTGLRQPYIHSLLIAHRGKLGCGLI